ncbi:MAG: transposase [Ruminococcaceae bacterium]|nr:transposase [Oscillospiraceae bacterium]
MNNSIDLHALIVITTHKLAEKANEMFRAADVPIQYDWNAVGTASSEMIDVLGLGSPERCVLITFLPGVFAGKMLRKLKRELKLSTVNSGIAFTLPLSGASNILVRMTGQLENNRQREVETKMNDIKHYLIIAAVNQGYSEKVMEAARGAGARGGTVVPSRCIGNEQATVWGVSLQEEKDMVLIVANKDNKLSIMKEISEKCGAHSEAKGMVISLPIDTALGLSDQDDE